MRNPQPAVLSAWVGWGFYSLTEKVHGCVFFSVGGVSIPYLSLISVSLSVVPAMTFTDYFYAFLPIGIGDGLGGVGDLIGV